MRGILFPFGIYHPATAPVYALLGRACVRRRRMGRREKREADDRERFDGEMQRARERYRVNECRFRTAASNRYR